MLRRMAGRFCALLCVMGGVWFSQTGSAGATTGTVWIGEVGWAGSSKSTADEWLEVWNCSTEPVSLAGYKLVGAGGTNGITFDETASIPPLSAFLVANYMASDTKSVLATDPNVVTTTISLANDGFRIQLLDAAGNLVDEAGDGGSPPAGITSSTKSSMLRVADGTWETAEERMGFDEGILDFGTPGFCDGCSWVEATTTEVNVTSTEPFVTSTEPVIQEATATETIISATTTIELPVQTPAPVPEVVIAPVTTVIEIHLPDIRLARIFPAPSSGKEWIELSIPAGVTTDALSGWSLHDAAGKIMTLEDEVSNKIEIPSSRLNNSGDTVELHRPDGSVAERMTYNKTPREAYWEKNSDQTAWVLNDPDASNKYQVASSMETIAPVSPPPPIELPTISKGDDETKGATTRVASETGPRGSAARPAEAVGRSMPRGGEDDRTLDVATKKSKTIKHKSSKLKAESSRAITFDMLTKIEPNVRVALTGIVATKPGILNKNQFVILSADGHGLLVFGSSRQPSPPYGSTVRVSGMLRLDDAGLSLHLATKDRWTSMNATSTAQPRTVDLLNPVIEDGWSLVDVQATVREVKASNVLLDLGDATADLRAKPVTGYRLARLKVGDVIRVRSLVDLRGVDPVFVVREPDDVTLIKHATLAKTSDTRAGLPSWTPFGAAGITVAITQGFKRLKRLRDERRIQNLVAKANAAS